MIFILFGLSGSGKNFAGELLAKNFDFYFWDADTMLPPTMRAAIQKQEVFTQAMRDEFTQIIIENIRILNKEHPNLAVAQALYKEKNRKQIIQAFPAAKLIQIKAHPEIIATRLLRNSKSYAEKIRSNFEESNLPHTVIDNNTDIHAVQSQLQNIINSIRE
jgi:gluconate kinase